LFNRLLDEILSSAGERCVEAQPAMELSVRFAAAFPCSGQLCSSPHNNLFPHHQAIESICQRKLHSVLKV
jgi:hypothetical protein